MYDTSGVVLSLPPGFKAGSDHVHDAADAQLTSSTTSVKEFGGAATVTLGNDTKTTSVPDYKKFAWNGVPLDPKLIESM